MNAKHQHYVPRHLLRGFLSDDPKEAGKERVRVFDLKTGNIFTTKIDNIMGEHRFNDIAIDDDTILTIDPAITKIEHSLHPLIDRLRSERRLDLTAQEHSNLALMFAFQFARSRGMREAMVRMEAQLRHGVEKRGWKMEQVEGWEPLTEHRLKESHIRQQVKSLGTFTEIFAKKVFFLATASAGTSFYLSDNPVVMANDEPKGPFGNLGLDVPFIQLYLPIAHDLILCAYAPEVLGGYLRQHDEDMKVLRQEAFDRLCRGEIDAAGMKRLLEKLDRHDGVKELIARVRAGEPSALEPANVARYNSLQAFYAVRLVVDRRGDFEVARQMMPDRANDDLGIE